MTVRGAALRGFLALLLAPPIWAAGGERFVLAWPPTRYASAELVLWRDAPGTGELSVRVRARGLDVVLDLPASAVARVPLPPEAQCVAGVDACVIEALRVAGNGTFGALLQSPDTAGAADTLLLTAHDTVRLMPSAVAPSRWSAVSMPCAPSGEMPMTASFATIVPVSASGPVRVRTSGAACVAAADVVLAAGESLTVTCSGLGEDLSGLLIDADGPIVVLSGNSVTTVPVDPGRGLSGDLVMDLGAEASGPARYAVPALPRSAALAGRGDIVRIVALEDARVRVRDDRGGDRLLSLAAGEALDLDTAAPGADMVLSLESDASIAAWHVPKSRLHRGVGDSAGIPLVPSTRFTLADRFFVPEGYAEANALMIAAEPGTTVLLDGVAVALRPAPGGGLLMARVDLPPAPAGGSMHALSGDGPFGAWLAVFGGYKASGHVAAASWPSADPWLLRGAQPQDLQPLTRVTGRAYVDADSSPLLHWRVEDAGAVLRVARCAGGACLTW